MSLHKINNNIDKCHNACNTSKPGRLKELSK